MYLSTNEILAYRVLQRPVDERWIEWAVYMLEQGYDTPNLCTLAGESPPYENNQFELLDLVDETLKELDLVWVDKEQIIKEYVAELLQSMIDGTRTSQMVLHDIYNLWIELSSDNRDYLFDFYMLYFAQKDLEDLSETTYWPGANSSNIENIIQDSARNWFDEFMS